MPPSRIDVDPVCQIAKDDVVDDPLFTAVVGGVDTVIEPAMGPVVVDDAAVQLGGPGVLPETHAFRARVVHDQVHELAIRPVRLERVPPLGDRIRLHDLESPVDGVGPADMQAAVDRGTLAPVLAHDDGRGARAAEPGLEGADVGAAAQPNRVPRLHHTARSPQRRREIPWPRPTAVVTRRPRRRRVVGRGGPRAPPGHPQHGGATTEQR